MSILPIFIPHAGCPHQCVFCNQRTISGQMKPALEGAQEQIERWLHWFKPGTEQEAAFYGGSFTALDVTLQEQLFALTDKLCEQQIIGRVRLSTRPDAINDEILQLLLKHRVYLVELGVQSLDDAVLCKAERGHNAGAVYKAMSLLQKYNFQTGIQLMVGMPKQSFASLQDTIARVIDLKPDIARIYPLLVIKGTPLEQAYLKGEFAPLDLEKAVEQAAYAYEKLTESGIRVIRVGLQADEELCKPGNIIAGPFHPSMGELVKSRILRQKLERAIGRFKENASLTKMFDVPIPITEGVTIAAIEQKNDAKTLVALNCSRKLISQIKGIKSCNMHYFEAQRIIFKIL